MLYRMIQKYGTKIKSPFSNCKKITFVIKNYTNKQITKTICHKTNIKKDS